MRTRQRRQAAAWLIAGVLLMATGCASGTSPAEQLPALARGLDRVDSAIAAENYAGARDSIDDLVDVTVEARDAGDIESGEADRILAAAARLRSALPADDSAPAPPPEPGTDPSPGVTADPSPEPDEDQGDDEQGKGNGKGNNKDKNDD